MSYTVQMVRTMPPPLWRLTLVGELPPFQCASLRRGAQPRVNSRGAVSPRLRARAERSHRWHHHDRRALCCHRSLHTTADRRLRRQRLRRQPRLPDTGGCGLQRGLRLAHGCAACLGGRAAVEPSGRVAGGGRARGRFLGVRSADWAHRRYIRTVALPELDNASRTQLSLSLSPAPEPKSRA